MHSEPSYFIMRKGCLNKERGLVLIENEHSLVDSYGRVIRKLRLSVIDKCNFRCNFCMPDEPEWLPNDSVFTSSEIQRVVRILANLGVDRVPSYGRRTLGQEGHCSIRSRSLSDIPKLKRLGLTTNGYFLEEKAADLKDAGLYSITVSLHSLRASRFLGITKRDAFAKVLKGIQLELKVLVFKMLS